MQINYVSFVLCSIIQVTLSEDLNTALIVWIFKVVCYRTNSVLLQYDYLLTAH